MAPQPTCDRSTRRLHVLDKPSRNRERCQPVECTSVIHIDSVRLAPARPWHISHCCAKRQAGTSQEVGHCRDPSQAVLCMWPPCPGGWEPSGMDLDHSPPVGLCSWEQSQEILIYHNHRNPWNSALSGLQQKSLHITGLRRMKVQCRSSSRISLLKKYLDPGEEGRSNAEKGSASYKFFLSISH